MGSTYIIMVSAFSSTLVTFIHYIAVSLPSPLQAMTLTHNIPNIILEIIKEDTINGPLLST